jgi:hypothetical protein
MAASMVLASVAEIDESESNFATPFVVIAAPKPKA